MKLPLKTAATLLAAAAAAAAVSPDASAQSIGFYSMPSRFTQYLGYGYGAGHHAPIVRTRGQHPDRIPRRVRGSAECGPLYAAPSAPIGCYGDACYAAPAPYSAPAPHEAPTPAAAPMSAVPAVQDRQAWEPPAL